MTNEDFKELAPFALLPIVAGCILFSFYYGYQVLRENREPVCTKVSDIIIEDVLRHKEQHLTGDIAHKDGNSLVIDYGNHKEFWTVTPDDTVCGFLN